MQKIKLFQLHVYIETGSGKEENKRALESSGFWEAESMVEDKATEETMVDEDKEISEEPLGATTHFVLVHGISHGAWCWYKIRCLMESSGYKVSCVDLKSAGVDQSDANSVLSFDDYNKPLLDLLSALAENEKVFYLVH